jgi:hypothetical protein
MVTLCVKNTTDFISEACFKGVGSDEGRQNVVLVGVELMGWIFDSE